MFGNKDLLTVLIANIIMTITATAPVYSLSDKGHITFFGLGIICGSLAAMNLIAGGALTAFKQAEGKYFLRAFFIFFPLSFILFLLPLLSI